MLDSIV